MVMASVSTFQDHNATPAARVAARKCFSCHTGIVRSLDGIGLSLPLFAATRSSGQDSHGAARMHRPTEGTFPACKRAHRFRAVASQYLCSSKERRLQQRLVTGDRSQEALALNDSQAQAELQNRIRQRAHRLWE